MGYEVSRVGCGMRDRLEVGVSGRMAQAQGVSATAGCRAGKDSLGTSGLAKASKEVRGRAATQSVSLGSNTSPEGLGIHVFLKSHLMMVCVGAEECSL